MQGIVIDLYSSEAYIAMPDGINISVGLAHLPSNIKIGSKVNISANSMQMINHKMSEAFL
jgi:hypothetical protein